MATRAKPLYDNCMMQAPDGEVLSTCDRKKAEWYVRKELAEIVPDQPNYTIRLKFEPKGRSVGDVGQYYQMAKENRCVVCGEKNSFIRKNVVPRDYRKHFPLVMKEHNSHDVLLLCAPCHRTSNMSDDNMRLKLAAICSAPYTSKENPKEVRVESMKDLRKIAKALLFGTQIPEERRRSLEGRMRKLLPLGTEITENLLNIYANISTCVPNGDYFSQGQKVADYYRIQPGGLSELERMWREHFLRTMKPKFLPELWSVEHNYKRLEINTLILVYDFSEFSVGRIRHPYETEYSSFNTDPVGPRLAGLQIPVSRIDLLRKANFGERFGTGAPIFFSAILNYLSAKVLQFKGNGRTKVVRQLKLAVQNDVELNKLLPARPDRRN
ncbi:exonuclease 3'-5' domain-containing protein 2-like [Uranotaenia lowii]|uniref:exonuclease 3'-5' domain-containing protein 2-like n=1 Tax=Uranotaenia lowii TaxID=190385 RepID=UPI002478A260|nr:exonuclease 3'-5' domain-containing protein 2-like [Uranotaenia lowii]